MAKRWRAEMGATYFYVDSDGFGDFSEFNVSVERDRDELSDRYRWQDGNYFKTREQAVGVCILINKILKRLYDNNK